MKVLPKPNLLRLNIYAHRIQDVWNQEHVKFSKLMHEYSGEVPLNALSE